MKGSTVIVGVIGLIVGLVIGIFALSPGSETAVTVESGDEGATSEPAAKPIRWKMASSFAGNLVQLGDQGKIIEERVRTLSDGTMELKFFEPGALVPPLDGHPQVSLTSSGTV